MFHPPQLIQNKPSILIKEPLTSPFLNPEKTHQQKTSQSSLLQQSKQHIGLDEYTKLQQLLQNRQASLRQHAKHSYQLKLYIEDLEEKNRTLEKNNKQIMVQYKSEVLGLKKQNDGLRKVMKLFQNENVDLKKQLQHVLLKNGQKITSIEGSTMKIQSQSVIKVIDYQDHQSFRQTLVNSKLLTGKQSPILQNYSASKSRLNSHSREKLEVTMKTSREERSRTLGRNQKHIGSQELLKFDSQQHQRSIKKLIDIKKLQDPIKNKNEQIKFQKLFGQKNIKLQSHKRGFSEPRSQSDSNKQENLIQKQKMTIRKLAKQFQAQYPQSNKQNNINKNTQKGSMSIRKRKNQHELIKLGHYGQSGSNNTDQKEN